MTVNPTASDLQTIRTKTRRVTGRLTQADLSDPELDQYINTYLIYDFPEQVRSRILQTNYEFTLNANQDTYPFPVDEYVLVQTPIFCDGYYLNFYQSQDLFYAAWPKPFFIQQLATGDGTTSAPVLANLSNLPVNRNNVLLSTTIGSSTINYVDNGAGSFLSDSFSITGITQAASAIVTLNNPSSGIQVGDQILISGVYGMTQINSLFPYTVTGVSGAQITIAVNTSTGFSAYASGGSLKRIAGSVNYLTGAISMDWGLPPDANAQINCHYYTYSAARPNSVLYFGTNLTFRPIPDQAYLIRMQVYKKPSVLLAASQSPELMQWWQLIAYGAALKIFADSLDTESYQKCLPFFEEQEVLSMRSTVDQKSQKKVVTPFSDVPSQWVWPFDNYGV